MRREEIEKRWRQMVSKVLGDEEMEVQSGRAPSFLRALEEEVIPYIEAHYRASGADRGPAGYSYGGLFVLYTLLHAPEMFTRYFAGSPSRWDTLFEYEGSHAAAHGDLKATLLMTVGSQETERLEPVQRMADHL